MSKTQQVKDALAGGAISFKTLHEQVGGDDAKLKALLYNLSARKIVTIGKDEERTITLRRAAPPQGKGKKPAGKKRKARKAVKTYRDLAAKANGNGHRGVDGYTRIALDNLVGAGKLLRQAIEDHVEISPTSFALRHAVDNHERAEKLLEAAGG